MRRLPRLKLGRGEVLVAANQGAEAGRGKILKREPYIWFPLNGALQQPMRCGRQGSERVETDGRLQYFT